MEWSERRILPVAAAAAAAQFIHNTETWQSRVTCVTAYAALKWFKEENTLCHTAYRLPDMSQIYVLLEDLPILNICHFVCSVYRIRESLTVTFGKCDRTNSHREHITQTERIGINIFIICSSSPIGWSSWTDLKRVGNNKREREEKKTNKLFLFFVWLLCNMHALERIRRKQIVFVAVLT